jgi:hypothetical protein
MDEETLGQYIRLWRLVRALQEKDYPPEIEIKAKSLLALFARELKVKTAVIKPKFLAEIEKALSREIGQALKGKTPPPNIPPNLGELVKIHQEYLAKKAAEELKAAGLSTIEKQVEETHQHVWQTAVERRGFLGRKGKVIIDLKDEVDPAEPEIPEKEQVQEQVYQVLRKKKLLDDVGQPDQQVLKTPTPAQATAITQAQKELASLLHFDELKGGYSTHVNWALEETPALLFYPERHQRLAVRLGREYAQKVNDYFDQTWAKTWEETKGDQAATQKAAHKAVETFTFDLFQNPARLRGAVESAVEEVFKPLHLPNNEKRLVIEQTITSLQNYSRRYLNPWTQAGRESLRSLLPNLPKEVILDTNPQGQPRLRVNPFGQPQNETVYQATPTQQGLANQTLAALKKPFGADAIYMRQQIELFMADPIQAATYWLGVDPAIGLIESIIPGAKQLHLKYIDYQLRKAELLRWYHLTPQIRYLFWQKVKSSLGAKMGLYRNIAWGYDRFGRPKFKPVFTPIAWLGKMSTDPFRRGADYFFFRGKRTSIPFAKNFWFGLGKALRRREADWDRSPLVLLTKLVADLTLGVVGRLGQKVVLGRFARVWTRLTETDFGKRFLGRPAIRAFRMTTGIGKTWLRSLFSFNTLSGGILGYAIGTPLGVPQLGIFLGGASGWHYEFYLNIAKSERIMLWLQEPGANVFSRGFRAFVRVPAQFFATHPYARFPLKGLAFGYVLYLMGFPAWVIPVSGFAHWAWSTRSWWGPKLLAGAEKIPGVGRILGRLLGFLSKFRFLGFLGRLLSWAFPVLTTTPLILDILSGTPLSLALQHWFSGPIYLGQLTLLDVAFLTKSLWWPLLQGPLLAGLNALAGLIPESFVVWLSNIVFAITSASLFTLVGIALLVLISGFTIYLISSAFFVERAITAHVISPELPIEKTVSPIKDQNGQIIALDYSLTYTYKPEDENAGVFDQITVYDRFEEPGYVSLVMLYDPNTSTYSPCDPDLQPSGARVSNTFTWTQGKCPQLGPLNPGESRTITLHLTLKNPPLSNYLQGEEMLCDNLTVTGQIQGGKGLSSSSPPVCINAAGETWIFGWPTSIKQCSSNYGYRKLGTVCEFHEGIDINVPGGTPVMAAARGTICDQGYSQGYGWYTIIAHDRGLYTLYAHLQGDQFSDPDEVFNYSVGEAVNVGEVIALSGNSGSVFGSQGGYHLHFGISSQAKGASCQVADFTRADRVVDPCDYLPGCPAGCLYQPLSVCGRQ